MAKEMKGEELRAFLFKSIENSSARLRRLRALHAPDVIIHNELGLLINRCSRLQAFYVVVENEEKAN